MGRAWVFSEKSVLLGTAIGGGRGVEIRKAARWSTCWVGKKIRGKRATPPAPEGHDPTEIK